MTRIRLARAALAAAMVALCFVPAVKAAAAVAPTVTAAASIPAPAHRGTLLISGPFRDGATVAATGLSWRAPALPHGLTLVSFAVAYTWQSCAPGGKQCRAAADSTVTPFAARDYVVGHADTGRAYAFNEVHKDGMTALWKNSPYLSAWGRNYTDGAVVEECYVSKACFAAQFAGRKQYGFTCTALKGATPCGWDDFSTDVTAGQPTGKWVGEVEYTDDDYVCAPGVKCATAQSFATFCHTVYAPSYGYTAVLFDSDLDGSTFDTCPPR